MPALALFELQEERGRWLMCAIVGLLSLAPDRLACVQEMTTALRHRGPDDEGYLVVGSGQVLALGGNDTPAADYQAETPYRPVARLAKVNIPPGAWLALGHRRLSILDLSPLGHQPMNWQGRYWMVYNGEVYNYVELRAELEAAGHVFISHCDTEVILAAYAQWGVGCFSRFNGMWAIALYDTQQDSLLLSRDRFGVKPLYYWATEGLFAFASEIKAFTCLPGWRARANGQAIHDFLLSSLQDHSRETMFVDVLQLEPGTYVRLNCAEWRAKARSAPRAALEVTRYYQIQPQPFDGTFEEASSQFRELLTDAVRLRLRADVPVGSCLSGGLDSSSIVCVTHRLLREQSNRCAHEAFSACSEIARFDERRFIDHVIAATGVKAHYTFPAVKELFNDLERVTWQQDEPFASTSIYAQWCVFRIASEARLKVLLDGQGADEQLFGYANFRRAFFCGLLRSGHPLMLWQEAVAARGTRAGALSGCWRAFIDTATPLGFQRRFRQFRRTQRPPGWLNPARLDATYPGRLAGRFSRHKSATELSLELLAGAHLQMLLHWEDRNSMAHSIESRVPFLDYRLVEFVTGLPDHYKIRHGLTKAVLREGMGNLVPEAVLQRRDKMGFVTPEEVWAREQAVGQFQQLLAEAVALSRGVLTPDALQHFERVLRQKAPYDGSVWRMISLGRWLQRFNVAI